MPMYLSRPQQFYSQHVFVCRAHVGDSTGEQGCNAKRFEGRENGQDGMHYECKLLAESCA